MLKLISMQTFSVIRRPFDPTVNAENPHWGCSACTEIEAADLDEVLDIIWTANAFSPAPRVPSALQVAHTSHRIHVVQDGAIVLDVNTAALHALWDLGMNEFAVAAEREFR